MKTEIEDESIIIREVQHTEIRGVIQNKKLPTITEAGDVYYIAENFDEFEIGDILVRNRSNTRWSHYRLGMFSEMSGMIDSAIDQLNEKIDKRLCAIEDDIDKRFEGLSSKLNEIVSDSDDRLDMLDRKLYDISCRIDDLVKITDELYDYE